MHNERKLFALDIWICTGALYHIEPEAPTSKHVFAYLKSAFEFIIKAHLSKKKQTKKKTDSVLRSSMQVN